MKKTLTLVLILALVGFNVEAQDASELKPLKVDVSLGYAISKRSNVNGGGLLVVEPKYAVMPNLALGLRLEMALFVRTYNTPNSSEVEVKGLGSNVFTADYYLSTNYAFRPFVGAGVGIYRVASGSTTTEASTGGTKPGAMGRLGFEAKRFRLGAEYNLVVASKYRDIYGNTSDKKVANSYIGFKLGIIFGGGLKE